RPQRTLHPFATLPSNRNTREKNDKTFTPSLFACFQNYANQVNSPLGGNMNSQSRFTVTMGRKWQSLRMALALTLTRFMACEARRFAAGAPRMGGHMSRIPCAAFLCAIGGLYSDFPAAAQSLPNLYLFPNENGFVATYNIPNTPIDLTGPFFQPLG